MRGWYKCLTITTIAKGHHFLERVVKMFWYFAENFACRQSKRIPMKWFKIHCNFCIKVSSKYPKTVTSSTYIPPVGSLSWYDTVLVRLICADGIIVWLPCHVRCGWCQLNSHRVIGSHGNQASNHEVTKIQHDSLRSLT